MPVTGEERPSHLEGVDLREAWSTSGSPISRRTEFSDCRSVGSSASGFFDALELSSGDELSETPGVELLLTRILIWIRAQAVLDIANACAATKWIRDGVHRAGLVVSVVKDPLRKLELSDRFEPAGVASKVRCIVGETSEVLTALQKSTQQFDVILLDAAADDCDAGFDAAMAEPPLGLLPPDRGAIVFRGRKRDTLCVLRRLEAGKASFHLVDAGGVRTIQTHQSKMRAAFKGGSPATHNQKENEAPGCFQVLGLAPGASSGQVVSRFRKLSLAVSNASETHISAGQEAMDRLVAARDAALDQILSSR